MSFEITTAFVKQFNATLMHLTQQKGSRLKGRVRNETQRGKSQFFDQLGAVTAIKKAGRHSDTPQIDTPHRRRRVTLVDYEWADLIDDQDKIRMLIDPASQYAQAAMWALGRAADDEIIEKSLGTSFTGEEGSTAVVLPNTQKLAAVDGSAGVNLNVATLRRAKEIFDANDVDESIKRYWAITASGLQSLLSETEVTSADFNTVRALVSGELNTFLGFEFIRIQRLDVRSGALSFDVTDGSVGSGGGDADGYRRNIVWAQDGLLFSTAMDMLTRISERDDKSYATQVYAAQSIGSTRMEEVKVLEVLTKES